MLGLIAVFISIIILAGLLTLTWDTSLKERLDSFIENLGDYYYVIWLVVHFISCILLSGLVYFMLWRNIL